MAIDKDWLSTQLNRLRPDREPLKGPKTWHEPIIDEALERLAAQTPAAKDVALKEALGREIRAYEGNKQRQALREIRNKFLFGQQHLDLWELARLPVAVGDQRVALGAMTTHDVDALREEENKRAESDFRERQLTVAALDACGVEMRSRNAATIAELLNETADDEQAQ